MIVVLVTHMSNGEESREFGGIACDVIDCKAHEPQKPEVKNLFELGWYIAPGVHRCPQHYHEETVPQKTRRLHTDKNGKRL